MQRLRLAATGPGDPPRHYTGDSDARNRWSSRRRRHVVVNFSLNATGTISRFRVARLDNLAPVLPLVAIRSLSRGLVIATHSHLPLRRARFRKC